MLDGVPRLNEHRANRAGLWRSDCLFHLHRLNDKHRLTALHSVTLTHIHRYHAAGHHGPDYTLRSLVRHGRTRRRRTGGRGRQSCRGPRSRRFGATFACARQIDLVVDPVNRNRYRRCRQIADLHQVRRPSDRYAISLWTHDLRTGPDDRVAISLNRPDCNHEPVVSEPAGATAGADVSCCANAMAAPMAATTSVGMAVSSTVGVATSAGSGSGCSSSFEASTVSILLRIAITMPNSKRTTNTVPRPMPLTIRPSCRVSRSNVATTPVEI